MPNVAVAIPILGAAAIAYLVIHNRKGESSTVRTITDHDRVASGQLLLRAWMNQQGIHKPAYTGDPWPSRPGEGAHTGEPTGKADDPVFKSSLREFQYWAHRNGFVYKPKGAQNSRPLRTDGVLDTATLGVLSAHPAMSNPRPTDSWMGTPSPAAFVPYHFGKPYYIAFQPGTLTRVMRSWSPTLVPMPPTGAPTKMIFDPTNPQPMPPPPMSAPQAWIAALHAGKIIALATYKGLEGAPADPNVQVFAVYDGPVSAHPQPPAVATYPQHAYAF